jgi:hypothetical protein
MACSGTALPFFLHIICGYHRPWIRCLLSNAALARKWLTPLTYTTHCAVILAQWQFCLHFMKRCVILCCVTVLGTRVSDSSVTASRVLPENWLFVQRLSGNCSQSIQWTMRQSIKWGHDLFLQTLDSAISIRQYLICWFRIIKWHKQLHHYTP